MAPDYFLWLFPFRPGQDVLDVTFCCRRRLKIAPRAANEAQKWLQWPEFLRVVAELRRECAARDSTGRLRRRSHVAWSLQRYLIFAILSCVPGAHPVRLSA